jgi:protein tyrosine/serine phosphatase
MKTTNIFLSNGAKSVNFREIRCGKIAPKTVFRASHPVQGDKQEPVIALLAARNRIAAVINLSDTVSGLKRKAFFAPWYNRLFLNGKIIALGMDFSVTSGSYNQKLKKALQFIIKTEGPWLIHCHAGIDRTGFVSMVIEALMGATIDEISADYLKSFNSIYESSIYNYSNKSDSLVVMRLLSVMSGSLTLSSQNLQGIAEHYLKNKIGLSNEEISALKMKLSKNNEAGSNNDS